MNAQCTRCGRPTDAAVCRPEAQTLADQLLIAAGHAEDAEAVITRQVRYGSGGPRAGEERPIPSNLAASRRLADAARTATTTPAAPLRTRPRPRPVHGLRRRSAHRPRLRTEHPEDRLMADKSRIEWTEATWNPTTGCDRVSPGCDHCYAMSLAPRLKAMGSKRYQRDGDPRTSGPGFGLTVHPDALDLPLRWTKPRRIFVNSMSDLFHDEVPDAFIAKVFAAMAATPRHTFQLLTKRHGRMRSLLNNVEWRSSVFLRESVLDLSGPPRPLPMWPLPNVWLGVSVEDQKWAQTRVHALLTTPAAVRWLSCEPLLGPVDLEGYVDSLDWVVVGGESGRNARPMQPDWARSLRDQCVAQEVPFFFKQWGQWAPDGDAPYAPGQVPGNHSMVWCKSKHDAGRELDGRTWDEYPS